MSSRTRETISGGRKRKRLLIYVRASDAANEEQQKSLRDTTRASPC